MSKDLNRKFSKEEIHVEANKRESEKMLNFTIIREVKIFLEKYKL